MTIKFREPVSAQACIIVCAIIHICAQTLTYQQKMNGRFFAGRRIEATLYTGKQRFRRSGGGDETEGDGDEAEKQRLDDFANWLMTEGD